MGVDALNGCRAIGIGSGQSHETQHFLLIVFALCHDVNHVRRIACLLCHRTFENIQETARAPCWQRVNWLTFSAGGAAVRYQPRTASKERPSGQVMTGWIKWAIALAIVAIVASATTPSFAQGTSSVAMQRLGPPDVEAQRESLLKQMIARPNDLDLAFEYATL